MIDTPHTIVNMPPLRFQRLDSTHLYLMRRGHELPAGTVVTTDYQEAGRGRCGRAWQAPPGTSLLASLLIKPSLDPERAPELSHLLALASVRALAESGLRVSIRWPNDLMVGDRKLAGILPEARLDGDKLLFVVLSIGVNLLQTRDQLASIDRPATSCTIETGKTWCSDSLLASIAAHFNVLCARYAEQGFAAIKTSWEQAVMLRGARIRLNLGTYTVEGRVQGFDERGAIIIQTQRDIQSFAVGEVNRVEA